VKSESSFPPVFEHQIQLMNKQLKRVSEFSRFLPFADQQRELDALVNRLHVEVSHLYRTLTFFVGASNSETLGRIAENLLTDSAVSLHESK
jgi:hypothetical protein